MLLKNIFSKKGNNAEDFDLNSVIGEKCVVIEEINTFSGSGLVKVKGTLWAARGSYEDDVFAVGETLKVVAIEGVKLICKK